jgi:type VI secretion system secreted protein Hcp
MAYVFYVTIEGSKQGKFKGDSKRRAHKDQIVGLAFDYEVSAPYDAASGQATGKRQHEPVTITKRWGAATPQLFQALTTNEDLKMVLIEFVQTTAQGTEVVYHTVKLINARVAAIHQYADADVREAKDVSFTFQKIEISNKSGGTSASDDWS